MTTVMKCPECGADFLPAGKLKGQCPACLVERIQHVVFDLPKDRDSDAGSSPGGFRFVPPKVSDLARHFPQLDVIALIGQGGMGAVYQARQIKLDRLVALKILPREISDQGDFAERFEREAKVLARLAHPNIVTIHDLGHAGDWFYFVMEYVAGKTLRETARAGRLSAGQILEIVLRICDAIQYAHDQGIVHRDIKPENILLDCRGNVKIADFGLAKLLALAPDVAALTRTRQIMGTPHYMAPEQMDKSIDIDHRADIYSLGVVFYELLTGELPLGQFEPPSIKAGLDSRLDPIVLRALAREPERRYQQAGDLRTDIELLTRRPSAFGERSVPPVSSLPPWTVHVHGFLALCTLASFAAGIFCMFAAILDPPNRFGLAIGSVLGTLFACSMARCLVGFSRSWSEFRVPQWLVLPLLLSGYILLALLVVLWPLLSAVAVALAPSYAAVHPENWQMFGEQFAPQAGTGAGISLYWLKVYGWGAAASVVWTAALATALSRKPSAAPIRTSFNTGSVFTELVRRICLPAESLTRVFHPASPAAIRTGITYAILFLVALVLPSALLSLYLAYLPF